MSINKWFGKQYHLNPIFNQTTKIQIDRIEEFENGITVYGSLESKPGNCTTCGDTHYAKKDRARIRVLDIPYKGKKVSLEIMRQRYECVSCGAVFLPILSCVHQHHRMTNRLIRYIRMMNPMKDVSDIAKVIGSSSRTVTKILKST